MKWRLFSTRKSLVLHEVQFYRIGSLVDRSGHKYFTVSPTKRWSNVPTACVWIILRLALISILWWKWHYGRPELRSSKVLKFVLVLLGPCLLEGERDPDTSVISVIPVVPPETPDMWVSPVDTTWSRDEIVPAERIPNCWPTESQANFYFKPLSFVVVSYTAKARGYCTDEMPSTSAFLFPSF